MKIIITILIILNIAYLVTFGKYIFVETLSFKENGKIYYVRPSMTRYITTEMSDDFIPKELKEERYKMSGDYIDNVKKRNTTNISIRYRIFLVLQFIAIIGLIIYTKK